MTNEEAEQELSAGEYAETVTIDVRADSGPPSSLVDVLPSPQWWMARPIGSRLVGLVVARDDMPPIVEQREALTEFGVKIEGFRHPAPETGETWSERLQRLFGRLGDGDVLVVANKHALGRTASEETQTFAELRGRGVIVKVLDRP